ncbi:hypothetical protein phiCTC2A_15 (endogenous virus) [Clostridium phage phiCTC2A]|uniref:Uncharacterized protein n=1 Tax=Clostridium tetani (strain Massachusetts / E88) TaxID=212717 RepID=Q896D0_CLOTE|nr:hypothetical protein [Clostridium tetani]YP_009277222.1 hypothetical protein phiCTC2A_15 [Clostridium phage phiCTC2A]YP_009277289.1 hypothetical protein phiCT19406A_15 [Clostridium phage phiCT19406A]AAO35660.1 hypothetical protein CTC_01078 [Clostridium tetani E88]AJA42705.1 hypothetical protein phiCT19406A_15 [Clostridium phage phiCT19406A]AJA42901.1 hypothetical protein phiCTC2A_15 [Clostridium phage phiCTC2A]KGI38456.1 hypothetical protein KY52_08245 [Clostridium tetani]KGI42904.1 hypo
MRKIWRNAELDFIRKNKGKLSYKEMSKHLRRTPAAIEQKWQCFIDRQERVDKIVNKMDVAEKKFRFNKGQKVKTKRMEWTTGWDTLITKGKVIADNKYFVVLDNGVYKECVNKVDLYTKSVVLV